MPHRIRRIYRYFESSTGPYPEGVENPEDNEEDGVDNDNPFGLPEEDDDSDNPNPNPQQVILKSINKYLGEKVSVCFFEPTLVDQCVQLFVTKVFFS